MPRITPISWQEFEKFLFSIGCTFVRQKGDHRVYTRPGLKRPIIIPQEKDIPVFILHNNLRDLGISRQDYLNALNDL